MPVQLLPRDAVQRPTKARSTVLAAAAVVLAVVLSACGTPDRKAEGDRLERVINAMPGVVDARVDYTNDSERGATLKLSTCLTRPRSRSPTWHPASTRWVEVAVGGPISLRGTAIQRNGRRGRMQVWNRRRRASRRHKRSRSTR
jgi:hypothetical protein